MAVNYEDHNSFSVIFSVCLRIFDHLNLKFLIFSGHTASFFLKLDHMKFRILEIWNFQPCKCRLMITFANSLDPDHAWQNVQTA